MFPEKSPHNAERLLSVGFEPEINMSSLVLITTFYWQICSSPWIARLNSTTTYTNILSSVPIGRVLVNHPFSDTSVKRIIRRLTYNTTYKSLNFYVVWQLRVGMISTYSLGFLREKLIMWLTRFYSCDWWVSTYPKITFHDLMEWNLHLRSTSICPCSVLTPQHLYSDSSFCVASSRQSRLVKDWRLV